MSEEDVMELQKSLVPVRLMLAKLRALANAIKNSSTILLPLWNTKLEELNLNIRMIPRDVSTWWNSTFDMLNFAIDYRVAIDSMTSIRDLRKYELDNTEWVMAIDLCDTLKIFKHATLFFSRSTPNLSTVIPAMDHIDAQLATATSRRSTYSILIRAALAIGKRTLNRYYNKTNHSEVYRIAMVLHPRHKLQYFKNAGWDEAWIETAHAIVREEFDRTYAFMDVDNESTLITTSSSLVNNTNMFDKLPALSALASSELRDELERYLSTDPEYVTNVCAWWHERRDAYPCLHHMALNYHTIPATSVDVERIFSQGRILMSHLRSRLLVQSTRALMCIGEWSRLGYMNDIDIKDAVAQPEVPMNAKEDQLAEGWYLV